MIQKVTFDDFRKAFDSMSAGYKNKFTIDGKIALFDYLEQYEEDTGEQVELDILALCSEYTEYQNLKELQANYSDIKSMEDLEDHTTVIKIEGSEGFIIQDF